MRPLVLSTLLGLSLVNGANAREFMQPLELAFGVSCEQLKEKYSTETLALKNEVETLEIFEPETHFPRAYRMIASCEKGVFNALVISADPTSGESPDAVPVYAKLQSEADKKHACPEIEDKSVRCSIFQKKSVFVVFTGEQSDFGEFALVFGYAADPKKVEEKINAFQSGM